MSKWRPDAVALWAACFVTAGVFIWAAMSNGIPVLRQDWSMPTTYAAEPAYFQAMYEGWIPIGLGIPQPVKTAFLLGFLGRLLAPLVSPWSLFFAYLAAIAGLVLTSSVRLLSRLNARAAAAIAGAGFALFNPWVYTELVAGHLFMIAAYGAVIAIVAEFLRPRPRVSVLVVFSTVVLMQLQFALLVDGVVLAYCLARRKWIGVITLLLVASPSILGILAYHHQLLTIPYLLSWQRDQSLAPAQAVVFGGYFAHYADQMLSVARVPMLVFASLAVAAAVLGAKDRTARWVVAATALTLLVATGEKGPLAPLYGFAVTAIPETGLFRELYDLLAFSAIGYLIALAYCAARMRWLSFVGIPAATALLAAWIAYPPSSYWLNAATIPPLAIASHGERFALFPAFQPLQFHGRGSGIDPDASVRLRTPAPLNEYLPTFPVDVALARYTLYGDARMLSALGVSTLYERPYFRSDTSALGQSISHAGSGLAALNHTVKSIRIPAMPLAALADRLVLGSLASDPSRTAVFVGDVPADIIERFGFAGPVTVQPIPLQRSGVDPNRGWIDARLAFVTDPSLGQAFGGAYTQTARKALVLPHAERILASIRGSLVADRSHWRRGTTRGYRWIDIPEGVSAVRCLGRCAIALAGNVSPRMSRDGPPVRLMGVRSRWLAPWLIRVDIPRDSHQPLLRINEAFSPYWIALAPPHSVLPHVRIDTAVNGYLNPPEGTIYCVQVVAFAQLLLELTAVLWCLAVGAYTARSYWATAVQYQHSRRAV